MRSIPGLATLCLLVLLGAVRAQGTLIGFPEQFALASDRTKALELLIPGSRDYYYYSCGEVAPPGK